mmetsp:Transcript_54525/g.151258  ORF Transcript_54525/g.151258 Transcript_54525/m.151258 type:complete len:157 (-) Transcript_54525:107-577(-)
MNSVLPRIRELSGAQGQVPFFAVVREVAPNKRVKEDAGPKGLGLGEFQTKYFGGNPVYWDEDQLFVKEMGNRGIKFNFKAPWWQPWAIWGEIQEGLKKLKDKGVEGNMVGDGLIQGGVLCIGPGDQGVTYAHFEENDPDVGMPADAIVNGVGCFKL